MQHDQRFACAVEFEVHLHAVGDDVVVQPVFGASVSADLNIGEAPYSSKSGTTGPDGSVALKFTNAPAGCYDTEIASVTAAGLTWDDTYPDNDFAKGGAICP